MDNFFLSIFDWGDYDELTCPVKGFGMTVKIALGILYDDFIRLGRSVICYLYRLYGYGKKYV